MELPFSSFISRELRALTLGRSVAVAGRVGEAAGTQRKGGGGGGRAAATVGGGGGGGGHDGIHRLQPRMGERMGAGGARAPRNPCLSAGHHDRQKFYITRLAERGTRPAK